MEENKPIIYQLLPRLFSNTNEKCVANGTIEQNGCGKFNQINTRTLKSIKNLGVTHIWYTGVIEHAGKTDYSAYGITPCNPHIVKGNAGSPYAIRDYYDVDPDLAEDPANRMEEFEMLIKRTHDENLKVIIDFVPNHVAREYQSDSKPAHVKDLGQGDNPELFFSPNNDFYYITGQPFKPHGINLGEGEDAYVENPAKATGNDCFNANPGINDWYETIKINYGVNPWDGTRNFNPAPKSWRKMLDILKFWAGKKVDGFRCDMAHMVPIEFWIWAISEIKHLYPNIIFIAEIYDTSLYHSFIVKAGFDYLYDKVTLYDTLCAVLTGKESASAITQCWQSLEGLSGNMLNFLENHDELRLASKQFLGDATLAIPAVVVSATISTAPFMIYSGQEVGEPAADAEGFSGNDGRTTIFDYWSMPTIRRWYNRGKCNTSLMTEAERSLRETYQTLLKFAGTSRVIGEGAFFDLMYVNQHTLNPYRHYAFMRHFRNDLVVVVANFDDHDAQLDLNLPQHAFEHLRFKPQTCEATEIFSKSKMQFELSSQFPVSLTVKAHNAVVWRMKIK